MDNKNIKILKINNMQLIFNFENSTLSNGKKYKKIQEDIQDDFVFSIKKTKIIAKNGIKGLYTFLAKIVNDPEHFMYVYFLKIYNSI